LNRRKKKGTITAKVSVVKALIRVDGEIERRQVYSTYGHHSKEIGRCYRRALAERSDLAGKLTLEWSVESDGGVRDVRQRSDSVESDSLSRCVRRVIEKMEFPEHQGDSVTIQMPLIFRQK
jgi:hypothetical protein